MPASMFQILYKIAYDKMQSEEGIQEVQAGVMEDILEGEV